MSTTETPALLSPAEVARMLGVSRVTVYRRVWSGSLPAVRVGDEGGPLRIEAAELDAWLEARRTTR